MAVAVVDSNGHIEYVMAKVSPMFIRQTNTRLVPYNPPPYDSELSDLIPVVPVPEWVTEVSFEVIPKENADAIQRAKLIQKIDTDVDRVYLHAIGNRGPEYTEAERQATEYAGDSYAGPAPYYVSCWAEAKGWNSQQAADDILTQAAAWRSAAAALRANRLAAKEAVRTGDVVTAMASWTAFVSQLRVNLGLPPHTP
jgi:hypothetical protein